MCGIRVSRIAKAKQVNRPDPEVRREVAHQGAPHAPRTDPTVNKQHIRARAAYPVRKRVLAQSQTLNINHARWVYSPDILGTAFEDAHRAMRNIRLVSP